MSASSHNFPVMPGSDAYQVSYNTHSGGNARWHTTLGGYPVFYPNRAIADRNLLTYTSAPLQKALEATGETYVTLYLHADQPDTDIYVYLEDVTPTGEVNYVSEGTYRASHTRAGELPYYTLSPAHSDLRGDVLPAFGKTEVRKMEISLLMDSHLFRRGHSIRIALAGADSSYFVILPQPAPLWNVYHGGAFASSVTLPAAI